MRKKVALVTGSSNGVGRAVAQELARQGYQLVINGRTDESALESLKQEILKLHADCLVCQGDVGNRLFVEEMFSEIQNYYGTLDVLVNNAGISYVGLLTDMKPGEWEKLMATNLNSLYYTCSQAIPLMLQHKDGAIVNISSVWGNCGASCEVAYSASKGGVNSFTKALAKELAPSNIRVNAVALGVVDTRMNAFLSEEEHQQLLDEIPMGRVTKPEEAANFIVQIADSPSYLTGQVITFDGGWT